MISQDTINVILGILLFLSILLIIVAFEDFMEKNGAVVENTVVEEEALHWYKFTYRDTYKKGERFDVCQSYPEKWLMGQDIRDYLDEGCELMGLEYLGLMKESELQVSKENKN